MGAYTWTFIRIDKLSDKQVKSCVEYVLNNISRGTTYGRYSTMKEEDYIKDWIDFHNKDYDYFVNVCEVPKEKMTDEALTKEIKNKMKKWHYQQRCYQRVLDGKMTFEDMIKKTHQLSDRSALGDFYIIKHKGYYYVHIEHEIFRNYEYCEEQFDTVEGLIKHLENPKLQIADYDDEELEYKPLTPELRQKIIDYYSAIGDGNFVVHFG